MDLSQYKAHVEQLRFGKRLPGAVYVYRDGGGSLTPELDGVLAQMLQRCEIKPEFNVIKFKMDELKVSFLAWTQRRR